MSVTEDFATKVLVEEAITKLNSGMQLVISGIPCLGIVTEANLPATGAEGQAYGITESGILVKIAVWNVDSASWDVVSLGFTTKANLAGDTFTGLVRATAGINFNTSGGDTLSAYQEVDFSATFVIADRTSGGNLADITVNVARGEVIGRRFFFDVRAVINATTGMTSGNLAYFRGFPKVVKAGNTYRPSCSATLYDFDFDGYCTFTLLDETSYGVILNIRKLNSAPSLTVAKLGTSFNLTGSYII